MLDEATSPYSAMFVRLLQVRRLRVNLSHHEYFHYRITTQPLQHGLGGVDDIDVLRIEFRCVADMGERLFSAALPAFGHPEEMPRLRAIGQEARRLGERRDGSGGVTAHVIGVQPCRHVRVARTGPQLCHGLREVEHARVLRGRHFQVAVAVRFDPGQKSKLLREIWIARGCFGQKADHLGKERAVASRMFGDS